MHGYMSRSPHPHQASEKPEGRESSLPFQAGHKKSKEIKSSKLTNMMEQEDYSEQEHAELSSKEMTSPSPKKKKAENSCKRFSDEQVKSLESMFSQGMKLEPRKKIQLARDLGLQPRQVSIWFQNKRARWKSKQMEQEYRVLKDNFDALNQQFESLKKENESLLEQIETLRSLLENSHGRQSSSKDSPENGAYRDSRNRNKISELKENDDSWALCSDEDETGIDKCFRQNHKKEEIQFLSMCDHGSSSLASPDQQWCNLPSGGFLDESCCPSGWWNL